MFLYFAQQAVHSGFGSGTSRRPELEAPQEIIDRFSYIEDEGRRRFAGEYGVNNNNNNNNNNNKTIEQKNNKIIYTTRYNPKQ